LEHLDFKVILSMAEINAFDRRSRVSERVTKAIDTSSFRKFLYPRYKPEAIYLAGGPCDWNNCYHDLTFLKNPTCHIPAGGMAVP